MKTVKLASVVLISVGLLAGGKVFAAEEKVAELTKDASIQFMDDHDPEQPEGNQGPLRINTAQEIDFGRVIISGSDFRYNAKYVNNANASATVNPKANEDGEQYKANYVQVTDNRGTNKGWTLQVSATPFKDEVKDLTLTGAELTLTPSAVKKVKVFENMPIMPYEEQVLSDLTGFTLTGHEDVINSVPSNITVAASGATGVGTHTISFGENPVDGEDINGTSNATKNSNISLFVPGTTQKDKEATYKSNLTWTVVTDASNE